MVNAQRTRPNVLITGTPGTGKTTLAEAVARGLGYEHVNIGDLVKAHELHNGYDDEYECYNIDEDRVVDELEGRMGAGGVVVDYHGCDFFPERWFDLVVVLRTDTAQLYDRLVSRGYSKTKLDSNMECEIMNVLFEEALDSYRREIVWELNSNSVDDVEENTERIVKWANEWRPQ